MNPRYFCLTLILMLSSALYSQERFSMVDILNEGRTQEEQKLLIIRQDPAIDTLINRHILANNARGGIDGWRIQIYRGGHRTASEDANRIRARFMEEFPDIKTYITFDKPNWFKVKVGDYRTREEAARVFFRVQARYPDAYLIRDVIAFRSYGE